MRQLNQLFENNRRWAANVTKREPGFFQELSRQQNPEYLWIGCADSRVPANEIVDLAPGELFVHRNVANLVVHTDLNCLSVIQYAVEVLRVKHIIVAGHYGCGGILAALRGSRLGLIDNWLRHVQDVRKKHAATIDALTDESLQHDRLCELNVAEQVINVCETSVVQSAWEKSQPLAIHGWIYRLDDGLLRDLNLCISGPDELSNYDLALQPLTLG